MARLLPLTLVLALSACSNVKQPEWTPGDDTGRPDETDADTDTDTDTDTDSSGDTDSGGGTGSSSGDDQFDDPGDLVVYEADGEGVVTVDLTDASGDSNQSQEFYLVVVNTADSDIGYRLRYYDASRGDAGGPGLPPSSHPRPDRAPTRVTRGPPASPPPPSELSTDDIGETQEEFLVRNHLTIAGTYATVSATLWALGDNVAIWVDDDVPIDWDQDCDGVIDVPDEYDAYGFDNCDLVDIAEIIDTNIIPNVRALYGEESDVNGDGRVAVVITPELNAITHTSDDEDDYTRVLASYAEPSVDLTEFNYRENPGSDEQEVIYVFAPDPYAFFNQDAAPTVESYTGYQLAAEVARSFTALVSYNQHGAIDGGAVEEDWVNDVLGTFAAEYCGFGAAYYVDAWEYLDAPHRLPLASDDTSGSLDNLSRGAQYLFGLWLYQQAEARSPGSGATLMTAIAQSGETGVDSIETGSGEDMADLVVKWQIALLSSGVTTPGGDPLVDPDEWPQYTEATTISAPPSSPGGFYGANGYQSGLNLSGLNHSYRFGTTDTPEEITDRVMKLENHDAFIYTPGYEFIGWVDSNYAAQAIRLTGITYDAALMEIQGTDTGLVGAVVRWNDPETVDYAVENIFAPTDANAVLLPALPDDGTQIHGVGQITDSVGIDSMNSDGDSEEVFIPDTDRWLLDLTDRSSMETVPVIVWLDRHFADTDGTMGPDDPWIVVAPRELVPEPTVEGTQRGSGCSDGVPFGYPASLLDYLVAQVFLSDEMYSGSEDEDDACGEQSVTATTCANDWDRDGVLDEDEPQPDTFFGQTRVMECTLNGGVAPTEWEYTTDFLDVDDLDEDSLPTRSLEFNAGGRSGVDGEEGYVSLSLEGGREYLIIVGAHGDGTGVYELGIRQVE